MPEPKGSSQRSSEAALLAHMIAPICGNCGGEIDRIGDQWWHVRDIKPGPTALGQRLPGAPNLTNREEDDGFEFDGEAPVPPGRVPYSTKYGERT